MGFSFAVTQKKGEALGARDDDLNFSPAYLWRSKPRLISDEAVDVRLIDLPGLLPSTSDWHDIPQENNPDYTESHPCTMDSLGECHMCQAGTKNGKLKNKHAKMCIVLMLDRLQVLMKYRVTSGKYQGKEFTNWVSLRYNEEGDLMWGGPEDKNHTLVDQHGNPWTKPWEQFAVLSEDDKVQMRLEGYKLVTYKCSFPSGIGNLIFQKSAKLESLCSCASKVKDHRGKPTAARIRVVDGNEVCDADCGNPKRQSPFDVWFQLTRRGVGKETSYEVEARDPLALEQAHLDYIKAMQRLDKPKVAAFDLNSMTAAPPLVYQVNLIRDRVLPNWKPPVVESAESNSEANSDTTGTFSMNTAPDSEF